MEGRALSSQDLGRPLQRWKEGKRVLVERGHKLVWGRGHIDSLLHTGSQGGIGVEGLLRTQVQKGARVGDGEIPKSQH